MAKNWWMKLNKETWRSDPLLSMCGPATRGIWIDLCVMLDDRQTDRMEGTLVQFARACRCSPEEAELALLDLGATGTADVDRDGDVWRVLCRRMTRELALSETRKNAIKKRWDAAPIQTETQNAYKTDTNAIQTRIQNGYKTDTNGHTKRIQNPSSSSSFNSSSSSCTCTSSCTEQEQTEGSPDAAAVTPIDAGASPVPSLAEQAAVLEQQAEMVYSAYPRRVGKHAALRAILAAARRLGTGRDLPAMKMPEALAWLRERTFAYARAPDGQQGPFTPHPATWYDAGRYLDDEQNWQGENHARNAAHMGKTESSLDAAREAIAIFRQREARGDYGGAGEAWDSPPGETGPGRLLGSGGGSGAL